MSLIATLARMEALREGRARPLATVRHRHLSERPMVFVPLTTAGEAGAPLGALFGTDREEPTLLVVPQPRDRDLRFAFLAQLAQGMLPYLEGYADDVDVEVRKGKDPETGEPVEVERELCRDAPQLLVPNGSGVRYVRLLGRSMRFRRTAEEAPDEPYPVPSRVPLLGRWMTHFGERALTPGSCLLVSMTDLLSRHWASGQSGLEDQHLGALLAWLDPPPGVHGSEAALRAETARDERGLLECPPAGPATDPAFDNKLLAPAITRYDAGLSGAERAVRDLVGSQLRPTWDHVWRGLDLLRELPPGDRVAARWEGDRWSYTGHRDRLRAGEPPQPKRDDAVTAAAKLVRRETDQVRLDAHEALDDPLVMAERRLAGEAFAGEVVAVEMAYSEGRSPRPRPLVSVSTHDRPHVEPGTRVFRRLAGKAQEAQVAAAEPGLVVVRLVNQMGRGRVPAEGTVPEPGDVVCLTAFEHDPRPAAPLPPPEETPWTHGGPPGEAAMGASAPDPHTAEDYL
ncbi:hypothetical protein [Wenjunlia tyrosinilytica]|uniref:Uncharacterized protein n=1 Tax=Wenjunlia tyrosinilytica TaxID=1544741 RepID=A0A917ZR45_9ACTN|nr:hypothetical protein [Wenjunlia tyrosinilytica]GGO88859.1 hypothetical protein GCM10012280_30650 [Wenjunlia tyrosinilytica]